MPRALSWACRVLWSLRGRCPHLAKSRCPGDARWMNAEPPQYWEDLEAQKVMGAGSRTLALGEQTGGAGLKIRSCQGLRAPHFREPFQGPPSNQGQRPGRHR